jgi:hypothetical protein
MRTKEPTQFGESVLRRACSTSSAAALRFSYSLSDRLRSVAGESHGDIGPPCMAEERRFCLRAPALACARAEQERTRQLKLVPDATRRAVRHSWAAGDAPAPLR